MASPGIVRVVLVPEDPAIIFHPTSWPQQREASVLEIFEQAGFAQGKLAHFAMPICYASLVSGEAILVKLENGTLHFHRAEGCEGAADLRDQLQLWQCEEQT